MSRNRPNVSIYHQQEPKCLGRMSSSEASSGAPAASNKNTESIESSTLLCPNRVLPGSPLESLLLDILLSLKFSLETISSLHSIKLLMRLQSTGTGQVGSSSVENLPSGLHGALLDMAPCITPNHPKLISATLLGSRLSSPETPFRLKACSSPQSETLTLSYSSSPKLCIETPKLMFRLEILSWPCKKPKSSTRERTSQ